MRKKGVALNTDLGGWKVTIRCRTTTTSTPWNCFLHATELVAPWHGGIGLPPPSCHLPTAYLRLHQRFLQNNLEI